MGFFDSFSDMFSAAVPWTTEEAEAPTSGGSGTEKTPAQKHEKGEGEIKDPEGATPDKRAAKDAEAEKDDDNTASKSEDEAGEDADKADEEEDEDEDEPKDPKEELEEECKESAACAPFKHHFEECVERVTGAGESSDKKHPGEDCVEEFFHLSHCATQCAAPKLWSILK